ncbi:MAG: VOC family protein [Nitriliruptorales bacterium]|nr:VOC family protein [Nitriliruptorales bacterium]
MLSDCQAATMLPVSDLHRARGFYEDTLGFKPVLERDDMVQYAAAGTPFGVFVSSGRSDGSFTQMSFGAADFDAQIADLRARGVKLEEYDLPGIRTENGVAEFEGDRIAWFKDPEDNLLAISSMPQS